MEPKVEKRKKKDGSLEIAGGEVQYEKTGRCAAYAVAGMNAMTHGLSLEDYQRLWQAIIDCMKKRGVQDPLYTEGYRGGYTANHPLLYCKKALMLTMFRKDESPTNHAGGYASIFRGKNRCPKPVDRWITIVIKDKGVVGEGHVMMCLVGECDETTGTAKLTCFEAHEQGGGGGGAPAYDITIDENGLMDGGKYGVKYTGKILGDWLG